MSTWDYLPARRWTPLVPLRRWLATRRRRTRAGPGEEYVGWRARVSGDGRPGLPPPGTLGTVVAAGQRDNVLVHRIEFPGVTVTVPMTWPEQAWPGIDLLAPP